MTLHDAGLILQNKQAWKTVSRLLEKGLVYVYEEVKDAYRPRLENFVFLNSEYESDQAMKRVLDELERKPKQRDILLRFLYLKQQQGDVSQKELLNEEQLSASSFMTLVTKKILSVRKLERERLAFERNVHPEENILNEIQQQALTETEAAFALLKPVLMQGITGSGKTHVYCKLIERICAQGKQVLYLLPEIALTPQIIARLRRLLPLRLGIYHSRFSDNERVEVWKKTLQGEYDVIIGARSSLWLPFQKLGLIIVDEEHESSYKQQDPAPRFHARDAALMLSHQLQIPILLGSATPSLESYYQALQGRYTLVQLPERYGKGRLPQIELIDLREEKLFEGIFSKPLREAMKQTLENKKQIILFQNRRGYSPFIICRACGWVPNCKYCDVSLTYHKQSDQLHCHYCGFHTQPISVCQACGSVHMQSRSFGTEKIEEAVQMLFPHARVQRFDWDSMRNRHHHQEVLNKFEKRETDILVGTQMVVKGLDFAHVELVGVLNADSLLSYPDFRVHERAFQMLEQVSGRAGRSTGNGRVLIQLYQTEHPLLNHLKTHHYQAFFHEEIKHREEYQYPPLFRMIRLTVKHRELVKVQEVCEALMEQFTRIPDMGVSGPAEPPVARVRNQYLREIWIRVSRHHHQLNEMKKQITLAISSIQSAKKYSTVQVLCDTDP